MATVPHNRLRTDDQGNYVIEDTDYPGHSVDALLEQGKVEEAREELERLVLEGIDSGDPILMTAEKWEQFRLDLHRKAKLAS